MWIYGQIRNLWQSPPKMWICDKVPSKLLSAPICPCRRSIFLLGIFGKFIQTFAYTRTQTQFQIFNSYIREIWHEELETQWTLNRGAITVMFCSMIFWIWKNGSIDPLLVNKSHIYRKHFLYWTDSLWCQQRLFVYFGSWIVQAVLFGSFTKGFVCLKTYRLSLNAPLPLRQFDKFELFPVWGNLCSYSLSASLNINGNQLLAEKTGNVLQRKCCKIMMRESLPLKNNFDFQFIPRILAHRYSWDLFAKEKKYSWSNCPGLCEWSD